MTALDGSGPGEFGRGRVQYAALPYSAGPKLEVLLITSRDTGRWVIPKGWPMKRRAPHEAAAREAVQEAGVVGDVRPDPVGRYGYLKRLSNGEDVPVEVEVFPLRVTTERLRWREMEERTRRWFPPSEAARLVAEPELQQLIRNFDPEESAGG